MKILAFDTALRQCSAALSIDNKQVAFLQSQELSKQSEMLFPLVNQILIESQLVFSDLDVIAVNIGPGSFTGVRIGVAAAKGLKLVLPNVKLIGITSLELLASKVESSSSKIIAVLEAGQEEYYVQIFDQNLRSITEAKSCDLPELLQIFLSNKESRIISNCQLSYDGEYVVCQIDAETALKIARNKISAVKNQDDINPFYIKSPRVSISNN
jgi:tRNA threonylcarbamoyl adenosine modification protein YeaZ